MTHESKYAVCPFYKKEDGESIFCEGVVDECKCAFKFLNRDYCKEYKVQYCRDMDNHKKCIYYQALLKKYK